VTTLHHNHAIIFHPNSSTPTPKCGGCGWHQVGAKPNWENIIQRLKSWNQKGDNNHGVFGFSLSLSLSLSHTHTHVPLLSYIVYTYDATYLLTTQLSVCEVCATSSPKHNLIVACLIELSKQNFVLKFLFLRLFNKMKNCHMYVCFALCCELFFSLI
jgi:hypothetical protein